MFAVIMAGGSGTRFWPISRKKRPKQLLKIGGSEPMIVETCNRLQPIVQDREIIVILGDLHKKETQDLLKHRDIHIVAEPVGRNTGPCIGLGAIYARYLGCEGAVAFLPADHFIGDPSSFVKSLERAGKVAESGGIVTLGIIPTRPETGYGYIHRADAISGSGQSIYKVSEFVEKPDLAKAEEYLLSGEYFWNGGIFVATPDAILDEIRQCLPDLYHGLKQLEKVIGTESFEDVFSQVYSDLESVSFDYGIMETTKAPVFVLPCDCGWSDVGSWKSLYELKTAEYDSENNLSEGEVLCIDCKGSFVSNASGRMIACLGVERLLVVGTEDAVLIADLERSQDIRKIVDMLEERGNNLL